VVVPLLRRPGISTLFLPLDTLPPFFSWGRRHRFLFDPEQAGTRQTPARALRRRAPGCLFLRHKPVLLQFDKICIVWRPAPLRWHLTTDTMFLSIETTGPQHVLSFLFLLTRRFFLRYDRKFFKSFGPSSNIPNDVSNYCPTTTGTSLPFPFPPPRAPSLPWEAFPLIVFIF